MSAFVKQEGGTHYKDLPIGPTEYSQRNKLGCCESAVVKYVTRHKFKNGKEDILKARHFLDMLLEIEYPELTFEEMVGKVGGLVNIANVTTDNNADHQPRLYTLHLPQLQPF